MGSKRIILQIAIALVYVAVVVLATTKAPKQAKAFKCKNNCTAAEAEKFEEFKKKFSRTYADNKTECEARNRFCKSYRMVTKHNADKNSTFKMAVTTNADKTPEENLDMLKKRTGLTMDSAVLKSAATNVTIDEMLNSSMFLSSSFGKLKARAVRLSGAASETNNGEYTGPVKDQGSCGSCWSFCANAVLQFQALALQDLNVSLSEQNIIDCNDKQSGCDGGHPLSGFIYSQSEGVAPQSQYPYKQARSKTCKRSSLVASAYKSPWPPCYGEVSEAQLKQLIDGLGVVAIGIGVTQSLAYYESGVYYDPSCPSQTSHCVAVVGFGTDANGVDYWVIKNSWGRYWGDKGYFKMRRGVGACGMRKIAVFLPCNK